ncbi:MAG: hemerythrin family protein [Rhodospirillales bacterium]|jgi:hemerythrin|nr:hemerythrin family protein [Rhodospirillales bacterium]
MKYEHLPGDLVTGVGSIDRDHDQLFSLVELFRTCKADRDLGVLRTVVVGLVEYTVYHFKREEIGFAACGFGDAASHEKEHRLLEETALQLQDDLDQKPEIFDAGKLEEVDGFLMDWLGHHISESDMAFREAF